MAVLPEPGLSSPDTGRHEMDERFMLRQRGDYRSRYVHVDDLDKAPGIPRPAIWSY